MSLRFFLPMLLMSLPTDGEAATRNATARTVAVRSITITSARSLDFGRLIIATTPGGVTINPRTDARTRNGGVTLAAGGAPGAARFTILGTPRRAVQVTLGPRPTLTRAGGSETMAMTALASNGGPIRLLTAAGTLDLRVGGTLAVAANQMPGDYVGSFTVTVDYR